MNSSARETLEASHKIGMNWPSILTRGSHTRRCHKNRSALPNAAQTSNQNTAVRGRRIRHAKISVSSIHPSIISRTYRSHPEPRTYAAQTAAPTWGRLLSFSRCTALLFSLAGRAATRRNGTTQIYPRSTPTHQPLQRRGGRGEGRRKLRSSCAKADKTNGSQSHTGKKGRRRGPRARPWICSCLGPASPPVIIQNLAWQLWPVAVWHPRLVIQSDPVRTRPDLRMPARPPHRFKLWIVPF